MSFLFDDPHDWIRGIVLIMCLSCSIGLVYRVKRPPSPDWNAKTKDYWFALFTWSVVGSVATLETLVTNETYTPRLPLIAVAAAVCLNGLRRKGGWGIRNER